MKNLLSAIWLTLMLLGMVNVKPLFAQNTMNDFYINDGTPPAVPASPLTVNQKTTVSFATDLGKPNGNNQELAVQNLQSLVYTMTALNGMGQVDPSGMLSNVQAQGYSVSYSGPGATSTSGPIATITFKTPSGSPPVTTNISATVQFGGESLPGHPKNVTLTGVATYSTTNPPITPNPQTASPYGSINLDVVNIALAMGKLRPIHNVNVNGTHHGSGITTTVSVSDTAWSVSDVSLSNGGVDATANLFATFYDPQQGMESPTFSLGSNSTKSLILALMLDPNKPQAPSSTSSTGTYNAEINATGTVTINGAKKTISQELIYPVVVDAYTAAASAHNSGVNRDSPPSLDSRGNSTGIFRRVKSTDGSGNATPYYGLSATLNLPNDDPETTSLVSSYAGDTCYVYTGGQADSLNNGVKQSTQIDIGFQLGHTGNKGWIPIHAQFPATANNPSGNYYVQPGGSVNIIFETYGYANSHLKDDYVALALSGSGLYYTDTNGANHAVTGTVTSNPAYYPGWNQYWVDMSFKRVTALAQGFNETSDNTALSSMPDGPPNAWPNPNPASPGYYISGSFMGPVTWSNVYLYQLNTTANPTALSNVVAESSSYVGPNYVSWSPNATVGDPETDHLTTIP